MPPVSVTTETLGPVDAATSGCSVDACPETDWNALVDRSADASFYQTQAYGRVSWGSSQLSHLVLRSPDSAACFAQLRIVRVPFMRAGVAYVRWGPCCRSVGSSWDANRFRSVLQALVDEYVRRRGLLLRIIPNVMAEDAFSGEALEILRACGFRRDDRFPSYRTIRVDLRPEPAVLRRGLDGKWRNQLNAAERNGLAVVEGTEDALYGEFLELYKEMMSRKNFHTTVDVRQFREMQGMLPERQKLIIMIARQGDTPVNALVASRIGETAIYLLGATSNAGMKSKGAYLLQWQMMQRLRELGCVWYDLGGINPEANPGVYHFKQGMGGHECRQLGLFSVDASGLSSSLVRFAEGIRDLRRNLASGVASTLRRGRVAGPKA